MPREETNELRRPVKLGASPASDLILMATLGGRRSPSLSADEEKQTGVLEPLPRSVLFSRTVTGGDSTPPTLGDRERDSRILQ